MRPLAGAAAHARQLRGTASVFGNALEHTEASDRCSSDGRNNALGGTVAKTSARCDTDAAKIADSAFLLMQPRKTT